MLQLSTSYQVACNLNVLPLCIDILKNVLFLPYSGVPATRRAARLAAPCAPQARGAQSAARLKTLVERARDEQQGPQNRGTGFEHLDLAQEKYFASPVDGKY